MTDWIGEPVVTETEHATSIKQYFGGAGNYIGWELWSVEVDDFDGSLVVRSRGDNGVRLPAHIVPLVMSAVTRLAGSLAL